MVNQKYIVKLLVFITLILFGLIVKLVVDKIIELPQGTEATAAVDLISGLQNNIEPTDLNSPENTVDTVDNLSDQPNHTVFYISTDGNNLDGKSWSTAWNELDQIQWGILKPGDTIVVGGGEYHTNLDVGASGLLGLPITITTNGEQVVMNGQRPIPPYCGEAEYNPVNGKDAIDLEDQSFIIIDGQEWSGIVIRNHVRGIMMRERTNNIIVRNLEIYDNGWSVGSGIGTAPDGPGVELGGSNILFERVLIHDNGQDAFQVGWGVWNFTLRNSWLYNSREHPFEAGKPFNYCSHTDGIQIYDGGLQGPVVIEKSIIGPSFMQGMMINNKAEVDDVLIKDTLFVYNANAGIAIQNEGESSRWTLQNVTIVQDAVSESWNLKMNGGGHQIRNSIFWGGSWGMGIFNWSEAIGNYNWLTRDQYDVAVEMNPLFVKGASRLFQGDDFADFNFTIQNFAIPLGTGSSIVSVAQLFKQ